MFVVKRLPAQFTLARRFVKPLLCGSTIAHNKFSSKVDKIPVYFETDGDTHKGTGKVGDSLLDVVINSDVPLDGFGACEGTLACCTCHIVLSPDHYAKEDKVNPAGEEELDLLDLAPDLTDESRLGCQIIIKKDDKEMRITVPTATRDARTIN